jgi:hypothetical protein
MPTLTVKAHALHDARISPADKLRLTPGFFEDYHDNPLFAKEWVSFTWAVTSPVDGLVYCGLCHFNNDVLYVFDPVKKTFRSLGLEKVTDRFDIKVHRSIAFDTDGTLYGGTAQLNDLNRYRDAPGGKLFRYDPRTGKAEVLGIGLPHNGVQCVVMDTKRRILYGFTWPDEHAFRFDIDARRSTDLGWMGTQPHSPVLDDDGGMWGIWKQVWGPDQNRCGLFRYEPDADKLEFLRTTLPGLSKVDQGVPDSALNGGDGYLYFGTTTGVLARVDPRTKQVEYLGHPLSGERMPGLVVGSDGLLYGCGGASYATRLFSFDRKTRTSVDFGPIYDPQRKTSCWCTHCLTEAKPGQFFVGETDNPDRSGYLWECTLR